MSKIDTMTMSEIVAEAINRGFTPKPLETKCHHWNSGIEVNSIEYLRLHGSDLFEEIDED